MRLYNALHWSPHNGFWGDTEMCDTPALYIPTTFEAEKSNAHQGYSPFFESVRPHGECTGVRNIRERFHAISSVRHGLLPAIAGTAISPPDIQTPSLREPTSPSCLPLLAQTSRQMRFLIWLLSHYLPNEYWLQSSMSRACILERMSTCRDRNKPI